MPLHGFHFNLLFLNFIRGKLNAFVTLFLFSVVSINCILEQFLILDDDDDDFTAKIQFFHKVFYMLVNYHLSINFFFSMEY